MGSIPLPALDVNTQQASPLDTYSKILQLQNARAQQALIPGQQQLQQQQIQGAQLQNQRAGQEVQQGQISLDDQKKLMQIYQNHATGGSVATSDTSTDPNAAPRSSPSVNLQDNIGSMIQDAVKAGVSPAGVQSLVKYQGDQLDVANKMATFDASQRAAVKAHNEALWNGAETLRAIPEGSPQRAQAYQQLLPNLKAQGVDISKLPQQAPTDAALDQMEAPLGMVNGALDLAEKKSKGAQTSAEATKAQQEVAPVDQGRLDTFTKTTLPSFGALNPAQKASFSAQAQQARNIPEFNKVLESADATDKAEQMHQDTLAQTKAIVGDKFGQQGLTANDKVWSDPHTGYVGSLQQANQLKNSIVAGADGNGLLTAMVPTMEVLGINHAAGINRISPVEAAAATLPPDWATRWNAWATKAASGKLTPELAQQGQQLISLVQDAAYTKALQSSQMTANGHGLKDSYSQVPAMLKDGTVTTLDKALSGGGAQQGGGQSSGGAPPKPSGATHIGVGSVDKKKHYLDASGKDLGLAE